MSASTALADTPLFKVRGFRLLCITRVCSNTGNQMQAVAVGWHVYELTNSALHLGMIGLIQFLAPLCLTLLAGQVADRYDRRLILRCAFIVECAMSAMLLLLAILPDPPIAAIYVVLLINSMARAFEGPSLQSLMPLMVPKEIIGRAVAAYASSHKFSLLMGPTMGGLLYGFGASIDYGVCMLLLMIAGTASFLLPPVPAPATRPAVTWTTVFAGLGFIWTNKAMLGAMSLDLIGSLFGGVTALLPIVAHDILEIGPWGFGVLRSSPAVGGLIMAAVLSRYPIKHSGGTLMFSGMAIFGGTTALFGLSHDLFLSIFLLFVVGAGDMLATVVRQTLIQVITPDDMRGRVYAVNTLFVNTGGQMGQFRAGVTAEWLGAVGSILVGGIVVVMFTVLWARIFPMLRRVERPDDAKAA